MNRERGKKEEEGKERGRGKREPAGMAKDFHFQMPVIYVMFKLTIQVARAKTVDFAFGVAQCTNVSSQIYID